ncbi:hypothetical protein AB0J83_23255 [Actinoplanes sp. NPDC049596]|uniref:hypothetical protein n=1 Tax=unclassified Actinoplanes TaxID=2626549 RepID=UPI00341562F7
MVDWVRLELDVGKFEDADFEPYVERAEASGTRLTTMAELGDTAEHRRMLYDLNKTCSADIPDRGTFYTYDEYIAERIDVATFDPRGVAIAIRDGAWIGMSTTSSHPDKGFGFSEMTGVLAARVRRFGFLVAEFVLRAAPVHPGR